MAGFCSQCGRPLPENGRCPYCAPAVPNYGAIAQAPAQPSAFSIALKNFSQFLRAYVKNPTGTTRLAAENHDFMTGIFVMAITVTISFFLTLFFALRYRPEGGEFEALAWLTTGIFAPLLAYGFALGCIYLTALVGKMRIGFKSVLAATGAGGVIPTALLAVALPFSMFSLRCFELCWVIVLTAAAVSLVLTLTRVFGMKCTLWQILITIGVLAFGYLVIVALIDWLRTLVVSYNYLDSFRDFYNYYNDIFG